MSVKKPVSKKDTKLEITEATFRQMLDDTNIPIVVFFGATWCAPCRAFSLVFDQVNQYMQSKKKPVVLTYLDIDRCKQLVDDLNIKSVPTVMIFKNSKMAANKTGGFKTPEEFTAWIVETMRKN